MTIRIGSLTLTSLAIAAAAIMLLCPDAQALGGEWKRAGEGQDGGTMYFVRLDPTTTDPNGNSVATNCDDDYLDATATLKMKNEKDGTSKIEIKLRDARPNTVYTVWLRLRGDDPEGFPFGGSPLTGGGSTPLAPSTDLDELLTATGAGNGTQDVANGFVTDENGKGTLKLTLDFPIIGGAYPFQNFENFDPLDPRFPIRMPMIFPVAIVTPSDLISAPFGLRIVSHCTDNVGHGLTPGAREPWFDWPEQVARRPTLTAATLPPGAL